MLDGPGPVPNLSGEIKKNVGEALEKRASQLVCKSQPPLKNLKLSTKDEVDNKI